MHQEAYFMVACKNSPSGNTLSLWCAALVVLNKLFRVCLTENLCCNIFTSLILDLFKLICISLGMMQTLQPQIWRHLGVILQICGDINKLNVVLFISTFCVTESTTPSKPPFSDYFIISLCRSQSEIFIIIFGVTLFWFHFGIKSVITLLDTYDGFRFC